MYYNDGSSLARNIKKVNIMSILDGTSKTLNVINQAIPIVYQVKPLVSNLKTISRVAKIMKSNDNTNNISNSNSIHNVSDLFFI